MRKESGPRRRNGKHENEGRREMLRSLELLLFGGCYYDGKGWERNKDEMLMEKCGNLIQC